MSSHSPTICDGGHGFGDTSITFGKSVLDGEVPYPADMAGLPSSTPNPSAMKRRTRKSWFETTPLGTKIEIAIEKPAPKVKPLSGEVEVLTLTHFTAAPRLDFGTMKPGQVKICTLLLRNPHDCDQTVTIEKVPEKKHFTVTNKCVTVGPGESYPLEVTWSPPEPGNFREMILMQVDKSYRLQAYVFGSVTAPPQKKKKRVGLLASKVSKPFSVIQTSSLASINHQYSPEKKVKKVENRRRSGRLSGQGVQGKPSQGVPGKSTKVENTKKINDNSAKAKETYRKKSLNNKENVQSNPSNLVDNEIIPKKKMRRSNTYSNVSNQGLLIPVIHGEKVRGQMDTSLIDIVDKCNVSGIQALEQSLNSPDNVAITNGMRNLRSNTMKEEKPSFLENPTENETPDRILSRIIPHNTQVHKEPSFLENKDSADVIKQITIDKPRNVNLQVVKDNETFHDSLENGNISNTNKYTEQPSFLSPADVVLNNTKYNRRSTRRSTSKILENENETTEVRLLRSAKRKSGRRSITKEKRRSLKSPGVRSIVEQVKSIRTFIKEKSFEIESGDEPSFLITMNNSMKTETKVPDKESCTVSTQPSNGQMGQTFRRDTFLADASKLKVLESQKPSEASPRRTTFTVLRQNPSIKSPARSKSEGPHKVQNVLSALDEALNEAEEVSKEKSVENIEIPSQVANINVSTDLRRKSESPKRLYSADSLEKDSFETMIHTPKQIKLDNPEFERRASSTVTKSRPSDALLYQMEIQTAKLFEAVDNSVDITDNEKAMKKAQNEVNKNNTFEKTSNSNDPKTPDDSFPSTPNQLPTSPNPDHSRRSTHVVKQPRIVDLNEMEQKQLFKGENHSNEGENEVFDSPSNNTRRRLSARLSGKSNQSDTNIHNVERKGFQKNNSEREVKEAEIIPLKTSVEHAEIQQSGLVFIPMSNKVKPSKENKPPQSRPKTVVDPKQFLRKRSTSASMPVNTVKDAKRVKKDKKESTHTSVGVKFGATVNIKKPGRDTRPVSKETEKKPRKLSSNTVKGLAQSKLILVKKSKTALPKHPLPFAAKNMYYDERWMEKQERGFVNWLNFVLTPAEEYQGNDVKVKVDAGKLSVDVAKGSLKLAPTNEVLSFRAYSAHRKLNRLRKSACRLFQSESVVKVIQKLEGEVESGRLAVRKDKMLHADLGAKQKILDMLLSYNPLWLRIGIETIYGEIVPLQSNSDVLGLSRYILTRLLTSPDIIQEYAHPTVPHLYRDGYAEATAVHSLKKFLMLVYFLDRAKQERLIEHNPCLFCKNSEIKASKDLLHQFSRDFLSGEGDITRHLGYLGYKVTYTQTALDEFDFAVSSLSTDLRDGLRLTKVMELLCNKPDLSKTLRVPAISRLQKVHNVEVVFKALTEQSIDTDNVSSRDIVDGHREKSLKLLWNIILHYQVEILLNEAQLREEIDILEKSLKVKNQLQRLLKYTNSERPSRDSEGPDLHTQNPRLNLLLKWCRAVCAFYNIKVENFTVSFSDGRALCHILNYYHPGLLPLSSIQDETSITHFEYMEENRQKKMESSLSDSSSADFGDTEDPEVYQKLLSNERENFKVLFEKVKELGGIPLMLKWSDMSNTIPDEKVVVTYLLYLCARLLDIRQESRAARIIQLAWRKYRVKAAEKEFLVKETAAVKIQRKVREFLERRRGERRERAAMVLQRVWRGYQARKLLKQLKLEKLMLQQKQAVCLLQRAVMGYLHRRRYIQMKSVITQFQACCRGYLVRKKRTEAATIIQSAWRSYAVRKHVNRMKMSIMKIQSCIRGHTVRKKFVKYKNTVVTVQRRFRAKLVMKKCQREFVCVKRSCVQIQRCWRNYLAWKNEKHLRAAVKLQAVFRGYVERRQYLNKRKSIISLQAAVRGFIVRSDFLRKKQGAIMIQRQFRNYLTSKHHRLQFLELKFATIYLQAQRRMVVERSRFGILMQAVVKIQACVRMFLEKRRYMNIVEARRYLVTVGAAITIQATFRGYIVRKEMKKQNKAAVVLEAFFRQVVQRKKFLCLRRAVLYCQERVRVNIMVRQQRNVYQRLRQACVTAQKLFRGKQCRIQYVRDRDCIIRLQALFKMALKRRSYLALKNAACLIQRRYRAKMEGDKCRRELQTMSDAARTIQSVYRGYCTRKELNRQNQAATIIQAHLKGHQQNQRYQKLKQVTVICQHKVRAKLAGKHQLEYYQNMKHAAVVIQKFYRAQKCRTMYKMACRKIVKAQSICKMFIHRRHFLKQRQAVVILQRRFRAKQMAKVCQNDYNTVRKAAITLQAAFRGLQARRNIHKQRCAAVCLQKYLRAFIQRRKFVQLQKTVCTMQRMYRAKREMMICRKDYMMKKSAVISVQAAWRGYLVRKEIQRHHTAAVCIQKHVKAYMQRRRFNCMKMAAITIQRFYQAGKEGAKCRGQYLQTKSAVLAIQTVFRGYRVRKEIQNKHSSATLIQACYRRHVTHCRYLTIKQSVVACQRQYRASKLCKTSLTEYQTVRRGVIRLQALVRGRQCRVAYWKMCAARKIQSVYRMYKCKKDYLSMRFHTIKCQSIVRGFLARIKYNEMKQRWNAASVLQSWWRAKVKGEIQKKSYLEVKKAAKVIQKYVRAKQLAVRVRQDFQSTRFHVIKVQSFVRGYLARTRFDEIKKQRYAACILQRRWRARVKGQDQRRSYLELKKSTNVIQKYVRAMKVRKEFQAMRNAAIKIQARVRGTQQRKNFSHQKQAVVRLQLVWRGHKCRKGYLEMRNSVIMCQRLYRAKAIGQNERQKFLQSKQNIVKLQSVIRGYLCRKKYQRIQTASVKIQSVFRGFIARKRFTTYRKAAVVLQKYWRAELLCRQHAFEYQALKDAAVVVQKNYRAKSVREKYLQTRSAIMTIQYNIHVWAAVRRLKELLNQKRAERAVNLERFVKVAQVHRAAIQIQRCYRNYHMLRIAREKVHSVTLIQRWVRSRLHRIHYLQDRKKIVCLQKHVRCWLARRSAAACIVQRAVRKWMLTFEDRKKTKAARKIQAVWKGYSLRRRSTSKKIIAARKRVMEANACATEENKLCNRTTSALDYLLKFKHMSYIIDALKHLEVVTRLSWSCCERMVEANAVPVLYRLIRSCNRSLPHMEIIQITVDIMLNLAKYDKTRTSLYEEPDSISTMIELMQIYRQKGAIFIKTCTLFGIMCLDCPCKTAVQKEKKLTEKLQSIHKLTSHKHKIEETQRKTKARMNATLNMTVMARSPVKRNKIKPDWSLHKDKLKEFDSPLKAINFVLLNLGISVK